MPAAPTWLKTLSAYLFALALSAGLLAWGLRLHAADLRVPLTYQGDALGVLQVFKGILENGWHLHNDRLGAPFGLDMHDYALTDSLLFGMVRLLGLIDPDPVLVYNLFYLLTYPLTTLTTMLVLRHFGASFPAAIAGSLLYTFIPYHYLRGQAHLLLSAYFLVPLTVMLVLWVCLGPVPFFRSEGSGRVRFRPWDRRSLVALLICALTGSGPAYYAFFGCFFLAVAGAYALVRTRRWEAAVAAGLLVGLTLGAGVANALPTLLYQRQFGANPQASYRQPEEADVYGLKVAQLLLPVDNHRWHFLAALKATYNSPDRPIQNDNECATLGLIGSAGFLLLLGTLLLRGRVPPLLDALGVLTFAGVLLGTVGGLGSLFNLLVYSQIRGYNRVSIYLAFFALLAVIWLLDRAFSRGWGRLSPGVLRFAGFAGLAAFGLWDQTNWKQSTKERTAYYAEQKRLFEADAAFIRHIEETLPPGAMVYELPYLCYPEHNPLHQVAQYGHLRGYLHSKSLRWSYGAMKGREGDEWQRNLTRAKPEELLRTLALAGFRGLYIDREGYADRARSLESELAKQLGAETFVSGDGKRSFFDLSGYAERLRDRYSPEEWEEMGRAVREPLCVLWQDGCFRFSPPEQEKPFVWCQRRGHFAIVNPSDRPRRAELLVVCRTKQVEPARLRFASDLFATDTLINSVSPQMRYAFTVPPGRHLVSFECDPPKGFVPEDSRKRVFFMGEFTFRETETAACPAEQASR